MTNEQFETLTEILKSIDSKLDFIESNTNNTESKVGDVEDELRKVRKVIKGQS